MPSTVEPLPGPSIGVDLPQRIGRDAGPLLRRYATTAEELGFTGLWAMEEVLSANPFLDWLGLLGYASAVTTNVTVGVAVMIASRHNPALLAKQLATLDHLSGGRLAVGLGVGHDDETTAGLGFPTSGRGRRLDEMIEALKAFWTEEKASGDGANWQFSDLPMEPKPIQQPHPPIWLGARQPAALRRAVRLADGWLGAGSSSAEQFRQQLATLLEALDEAGRGHDSFRIGKRVYISVGDNSSEAKERLVSFVDAAYGAPGLGERVGVSGSTERCVEELSRLVQAGARHLVLSPAGDYFAQLEALSEVARRLRA